MGNRVGDGLTDEIHLAEELYPILGFIINFEDESQDIAGASQTNDDDVSRARDRAAKY